MLMIAALDYFPNFIFDDYSFRNNLENNIIRQLAVGGILFDMLLLYHSYI